MMIKLSRNEAQQPDLPQTAAQLRRGLPFICADLDPTEPGRLQINDGLTPVEGGKHDAFAYRRTAFIPKTPWRHPTDKEFEALIGHEPPPSRSTSFVGLFKFSRSFVDAITSSPLSTLDDVEEIRNLLRSDEFHGRFRDCLDDVLPFCLTSQGFHVVGFNVSLPGQASLGIDAGRRLGLHVDDWDQAAIRAESRNRICMNLGREPRYFFYLNRGLDDIGDDELGESINGRGTRVGWDFMRRNLDYPLVCVRIDPFEAYIAPTDNLFHDGTSKGKNHPDITYNLLGFFGHRRPEAT